MAGIFGSDLYLVFTQGGSRYALPLAGVDEVLDPPPLGFVPQAPAACLGVIVRQGQVLAVLDAGEILSAGGGGEPRRAEGPLTRLIVLSYSDMKVVLRVDRVDRIAPLTGETRPTAAAPGPAGPGLVECACSEPDGLVLRLNTPALASEIDRVFQR